MTDTELKKPLWGFSAGKLKGIALVAMFIDHFAAVILYRIIQCIDSESGLQMPANMQNYKEALELFYMVMRDIGRISFPIYCFFIAEGFFKTKNRYKYAMRLLLLALLSEIPYDMALYGQISDFMHQNVYFTLLLGLLAIWGINGSRCALAKHNLEKISIICSVGITLFVTAIAFVLKSDYSGHGVLTIIMIYMMKTWKPKFRAEIVAVACAGLVIRWCMKPPEDLLLSAAITYVAIIVVGILAWEGNISYGKMSMAGVSILCVTGVSEIQAIFAPLLIEKYNGERGWNPKGFFYLFYPLHLILFAAIAIGFRLIKFGFN